MVVSAREGNLEAFSGVVREYEKRIFNFVLQFTRSVHDAEDVTQVTFVKAFRNLHRLDSAKQFAPWLYTIAKRTALNHFRTIRPSEEISEHAEHPADDPARVLERKDEGASIWKVARRLKPAQYEVLWLRYGEGFSVEETARIMNTNQIRVKVLLHRGRLQLAGMLARQSPLDLSKNPVTLSSGRKDRTVLVL